MIWGARVLGMTHLQERSTAKGFGGGMMRPTEGTSMSTPPGPATYHLLRSLLSLRIHSSPLCTIFYKGTRMPIRGGKGPLMGRAIFHGAGYSTSPAPGFPLLNAQAMPHPASLLLGIYCSKAAAGGEVLWQEPSPCFFLCSPIRAPSTVIYSHTHLPDSWECLGA